MKSKYDYDIIRDYLHGLVDQETARRIRELIREDDVARSIAAGILQLEHEFKGDEQEIEAYIEELRQKQLKVIAEQGKAGTSRGWIKLAAAILFVAVSGAVIWFTALRNSDDLLERELSQPYALSVDRGPSDASKGFEFYLKADYKNAITSFDNAGTDVNVIFYNGLSHLYVGEYDGAVTLLSSETLDTSRYREQASWFRALALVKARRNDEAKKSLEMISKDSDHYKSHIAGRLLEEID